MERQMQRQISPEIAQDISLSLSLSLSLSKRNGQDGGSNSELATPHGPPLSGYFRGDRVVRALRFSARVRRRAFGFVIAR